MLLLNVGASAQVQNKCLYFKGEKESSIHCPNISGIIGSTEFSIECWLFVRKWQEGAIIFSQHNDSNHFVTLRLGNRGSQNLIFELANKKKQFICIRNHPIVPGKWHHLMITFNEDLPMHQKVKIYINGKEYSDLTFSPVKRERVSENLKYSTDFLIGSDGFSGRIDEFRIWNKCLCKSEIVRTNTIESHQNNYKNLIAYWKMDHSDSLHVVDSKGCCHAWLRGSVKKEIYNDNNEFSYKIVSGYLRSALFKQGKISDDYLKRNNDIIYFKAMPYADGKIGWEYPLNNGKLINSYYLEKYKSRNGVLQLNGANSKIEVKNGYDLFVERAKKGVDQFTFETWICIDSWQENSYLFNKYQDINNRVSVMFGSESKRQVYFTISNGKQNNFVVVDNANLDVGKWHHVAFVFNGHADVGKQTRIYIDGLEQKCWYSSIDEKMPTRTPFINSQFTIGENFHGKIDDLKIWHTSLERKQIGYFNSDKLEIKTWQASKIRVNWKVDDSLNPAKDDITWKQDVYKLKNILKAYSGVTIRLGVGGGDWEKMVEKASSRSKFIQELSEIVVDIGLDGIDIDFEWCYSVKQWHNYSQFIIEVADVLKENRILSVTLHPLFYKITKKAIDAADFVSIQSYGPSVSRFSFNEFKKNIDVILEYGFPKNRLVMGLPFYGVSSDNSKLVRAYNKIVTQHLDLKPNTDEVYFDFGTNVVKKITFNGQNTIRNKTKYIKDKQLLGVMTWDMYTDVDVTNPLSLMGALNSQINPNIEIEKKIEFKWRNNVIPALIISKP